MLSSLLGEFLSTILFDHGFKIDMACHEEKASI